MASVPTRVAGRISTGLKKFQPILASAKARDLGEADTVTIIKDLLHEVFGYDKYGEITSEHAIRSTFCDLAVQIDGQLAMLIEVKAIGLDLKDNHVKQAVDYAANKGCDWVLLSNGIIWRVYKVVFAKPIDAELVIELNLLELNARSDSHIEMCWLLAKEGWQKARLGEYHTQRQALSRFSIAAVVLSDPVLDATRRELRRLSPDVKLSTEEIAAVLRDEVLKREVLSGDKADAARRMVSRAAKKALRSAASKTTGQITDAAVEATVAAEGS